MPPPAPSVSGLRRALIIGASGLVGAHLREALLPTWDVIGTWSSHPLPGLVRLDLREPAEILRLAKEIRPQVIFCPAAEAGVERCEADPKATRLVNVDGIRHVREACQSVRAKIVHFSTDYVFDGEAAPYSEESLCCPVNEYGRQKVESELLVRLHPDHLIFRVSGVYGWEPSRKNHVIRIVDRLRAGQRMPVWVDQVLTPTWAKNLADVARELVECDSTGTFHLCGGQPLSRLAFAQAVCRVFELDPALLDPVEGVAPLRESVIRPRNVGLRIDKIRAVIKTRLLCPEEGLAGMKANDTMVRIVHESPSSEKPGDGRF